MGATPRRHLVNALGQRIELSVLANTGRLLPRLVRSRREGRKKGSRAPMEVPPELSVTFELLRLGVAMGEIACHWPHASPIDVRDEDANEQLFGLIGCLETLQPR
jgi:hypothetical protein